MGAAWEEAWERQGKAWEPEREVCPGQRSGWGATRQPQPSWVQRLSSACRAGEGGGKVSSRARQPRPGPPGAPLHHRRSRRRRCRPSCRSSSSAVAAGPAQGCWRRRALGRSTLLRAHRYMHAAGGVIHAGRNLCMGEPVVRRLPKPCAKGPSSNHTLPRQQAITLVPELIRPNQAAQTHGAGAPAAADELAAPAGEASSSTTSCVSACSSPPVS